MGSFLQADGQTALDLRLAAKECSDRGLVVAAKWWVPRGSAHSNSQTLSGRQNFSLLFQL